MTSYLTSFATAKYRTSLAVLIGTAVRHGIDEVRPWRPEDLRSLDFFRAHQAVLEQPRGAGYWLWKPFIIREVLREARNGDPVVYADAGVAITDSLGKLFALCREKEMLLFVGHYDGVCGQPNVCRAWTKRDCFVLTGCDAPRYHEARMLDAAFIVLTKSERVQRLVDEWLSYCCDSRILTDSPNTCGQPNLPGFVDHRHDQSVLSLLAARDRLELFRGPSQFGNHCKVEHVRVAGEWLRQPYGTDEIYANSEYGTLLFHHRKRSLTASSYEDVVRVFLSRVSQPVCLLQIGDEDEDALVRACGSWRGATLLRVCRAALEGAFQSTSGSSHGDAVHTCCRDYSDAASYRTLTRAPFGVIVSDASTLINVALDLRLIRQRGLLDKRAFVLCWSRLEGIDGWAAFEFVQRSLWWHFGTDGVYERFGFVDEGRGEPRTIGVVSNKIGILRQ